MIRRAGTVWHAHLFTISLFMFSYLLGDRWEVTWGSSGVNQISFFDRVRMICSTSSWSIQIDSGAPLGDPGHLFRVSMVEHNTHQQTTWHLLKNPEKSGLGSKGSVGHFYRQSVKSLTPKGPDIYSIHFALVDFIEVEESRFS